MSTARERPRAMQITETVSDGLKREFQVSVPAADLEAKLADRLAPNWVSLYVSEFRSKVVTVANSPRLLFDFGWIWPRFGKIN